MASPPNRSRLNPTIFDKLVADNEISGMRGAELDRLDEDRSAMSQFSVSRIEQFNEASLRATVRRELAWLLNTTNLDAAVDLSAYPQVQSSVLNYGVPDLAGKSITRRVLLQRAREIRKAIRQFEPRFDEATLRVDVSERIERDNAITFVINGDIRSAVRAIPVKFRTDVESDTAAVTVRE